MKRFFSTLITGALLLSSFVGCGQSVSDKTDEATGSTQAEQTTTAAEKSKIIYWHWDGNPTATPIYEGLISKFTGENPNIEVELVTVPAESSRQKYVTAVATNSAPDAGGMPAFWSPDLITLDALEPVDDIYANWSEKANIPESVVNSLKELAGDGKFYMLPFFVTAEAVWYNTKLFQEKNITPPKTIIEMLDYSKKFADSKNGKYFFTLRGGGGSLENMFDFIFSYAGEGAFFDKEGNCLINGPKFIEGLQEYINIYKNGYTSKDCVTYGFKEMVAEFGSGTSMYIFHNSSSQPNHGQNLGEGNYMNAFHPTGSDGYRSIKAPDCSGAVLFKQSKNKEAAAKLITFLASSENASMICEKEGRVPVNTAIFEKEWYKQNVYLKTYGEEISDAHTKLVTHPAWLKEWNDFRTKMQEPDLQALLLGKKEPKEVLDSWASALSEYQKEYLKSKSK